jgi:hypothetical protein
MKLRHSFCILLTLACICDARPARSWTYEQLTAEADAVVIATPTENQDTKEPTVFPNMQRTGADGKSAPVPAVGVETKFEVQAILKGEKKLKTFVFYHLRQLVPENVPNGPMLVKFEPKEPKRYLMFLKREADGRYVALTGQLDSAIAVKDLGGYP